MNITPRIAIIGDLTADIYMPQKDIHLGGAALNMAQWVKRLGGTPTIFSAVGTDTIGKKFPFEKGIQRKRGRTSAIEIYISGSGERRYGIWKPGVLEKFHLRNIDRTIISKQDALVVTVYPQYVHVLRELQHRPFTIINYGDLHEFKSKVNIVEEYLHIADACIFGLDKDTDETMINVIRRLAIEKNMLTIVTLGKYGSIAWANGKSYVQPAYEVNVVDTTGAGDSFLAAFMVAFLETEDIQKSLEAGSRLAAHIIQKVGAY